MQICFSHNADVPEELFRLKYFDKRTGFCIWPYPDLCTYSIIIVVFLNKHLSELFLNLVSSMQICYRYIKDVYEEKC